MPDLFVDTSALLKLYIPEFGSAWMTSQVSRSVVAISSLTIAEVGVSLSRGIHRGVLTPAQARRQWLRFRRDSRSYVVFALERQSIARAANLSARLPVPVRTLDALQLQGAVEFRDGLVRRGDPPPTFIAADARLLAAAAELGFQTDDPNSHP